MKQIYFIRTQTKYLFVFRSSYLN